MIPETETYFAVEMYNKALFTARQRLEQSLEKFAASAKAIESAVEFYGQACIAEEKGETNLAEAYYLKSWDLFEQSAGAQFLDAASTLRALESLRQSRANMDGALLSARQSAQIMETHQAQFASVAAGFIHKQASELLECLVQAQLPASELISAN